MYNVTKENYNSFIESGNNLLIFLYDDSAASQIQASVIENIDNMIGKKFTVLKIDSDSEIEIKDILSAENIPAIIRIDRKKIICKLYGIKKENEILSAF